MDIFVRISVWQCYRDMKQKVNKTDFLQIISDKTNMSLNDVEKVYEAIIGEIQRITLTGKDVSLTGFGTFSIRQHKGHPVQTDFNKSHGDGRTRSIPDYIVFRFSSSSALTARLRKQYATRVCAGQKR